MQHQTHVFLKMPPVELPTSRQICCEKKTQVISSSVELVWHFRSNIVGPRNAIQRPKLKNTLQYVSVCCQFCLKTVIRRSSTNMLSSEWMNYWMSGFSRMDFLLTLSLLQSWLSTRSRRCSEFIEPLAGVTCHIHNNTFQVNIWKGGCDRAFVELSMIFTYGIMLKSDFGGNPFMFQSLYPVCFGVN